jgi:predicted AlkP superfamily phosphohydrolase/phosphomutase
MKKKTVVLGLDGGTWAILKPFAAKGYLPNLQRLLERGVHGDLESTMPAMTAPSWVTFVTGKHPGNHGVFDFMLPTDSLGTMKFATGRDIRDVTLYEYLAQHSIQPILVNLPGTYPPKLENAITITSLLTQGDQWIFPESLKEEFPGFKKYRLTPDESLRLKERKDQYLADLMQHLEEQVACVKWLFENKPWDFFFYLFSHTDWVSHLDYTGLLEREDPGCLAILKKIDEHLGWFVDRMPENANLIMVSDHGFKSYKKIFYFNRWLEQEGYLVTNTAGDQFRGAATRRAKETDKIRAQKKRLNIGTGIFRVLAKVPPAEAAAKWLYHHVVKPYLPVHIKVNVGVDFSRTKVCFPKGSYITNGYINKAWVYRDGIVSREEYPKLVHELAQKIRALRDPEGKPVVAKVLTREEVYGNTAPDQAPDLFFELGDYWLVGQFHSASLFAEEVQNKHDKYGIFLGVGPDFEQNAEVKNLMMQDMTPTILHLLNLPVPADCDGRVALDLFRPSSDAHIRTVQTGPSSRRVDLATRPIETAAEKTAISAAVGKIKL